MPFKRYTDDQRHALVERVRSLTARGVAFTTACRRVGVDPKSIAAWEAKMLDPKNGTPPPRVLAAVRVLRRHCEEPEVLLAVSVIEDWLKERAA